MVAEYWEAFYNYATDDIANAAKAAVGATGRVVTVHLVVDGTNGTKLVALPRHHSITCFVADHRSVVVVEDAAIDLPPLTFNSGRWRGSFLR